MSIAALYDIHGNLPALEAVLREVEQLSVQQIVIGGDVVVGPMSRECLDRLSEVQIPMKFVYGNCEVAVLNQMNGKPIDNLPETVLEEIKWTAGTLSLGHKEVMAKWPKTLTLEIEGLGNVLFCHATPRDENEIFTKLTAESTLLPIFQDLNVEVVICGHTHMQFDRQVGQTRIINSGSIGMPFGKSGAHWVLIDKDIELRNTTYNLEEAAHSILRTEYPSAKGFAKNNVLKQPSEMEMHEIFKKVELK